MLERLRDTFGRRRRPEADRAAVPSVPLTFTAVAEQQPGDSFQRRFESSWPSYHAWFTQAGDASRPSFVECRDAIRTHMPELASTYERVVELAGGGDQAARMLSLWCPPPYQAGCSQAVFVRPAPVLVRNYDYDLNRFEAVISSTAYVERVVVGMSDCLWGLLDGINDAGLAVSIAFGGRRGHGPGFGIALVVRYLLETCATVAQAAEVIARLPVHQSYNVTVVDAQGESVTGFLGPERAPLMQRLEVVTNHQEQIDWEEYAATTRTREREAHLTAVVHDPAIELEGLVRSFLEPPLYSNGFGYGFGTLYTAVYRPSELCVDYRWPTSHWRQSIASFVEGEHTVGLAAPA